MTHLKNVKDIYLAVIFFWGGVIFYLHEKCEYVMISVRPANQIVHMWQILQCCNFLRHCKYDKCQRLHDGSTH